MSCYIKSILAVNFCFLSLIFGGDFGYIAYETLNVGDDIQSVAAKRFLQDDCVPIDREMVSCFFSQKPIPTIMNGWFMWTKEFWNREKLPLPDKSWPPSSSIDPLLISMHICEESYPFIFTEEGIEYLKNHGPVGARDTATLAALQERGISSYFSGCLSLTLENTSSEKDDVVYAVDLSDEAIEYIKNHTKSAVKVIHHGRMVWTFQHTPEERLNIASSLLEKYQRAKCVVTTRLHACLPCLAYETPVLFITGGDGSRFDGLRDCYHQCSYSDLLGGSADFDFDSPPDNPTNHLKLRNALIETVTKWVEVKKKQ